MVIIMQMKFKKILAHLFPLSLKDLIRSIITIIIASIICFILKDIGTSDVCAGMVYIVAVGLISRNTTGYLYGIISSFICLFVLNIVFTYPYYKVSVNFPNYPATFIVFLSVALMISTMTTKLKEQEKIRADAQTERLRSNLLRAISHDLRTPLTSMIGSSSLILENHSELGSDECLNLVVSIKEDAQWLLRIVENLLSITRITGHTTKLNKPLEVAEEIITDSVLKLKKRFPDAPIKLDIPDEIIVVPMDGILIEQVILNLVENSIKHGNGASSIIIKLTQDKINAIFHVIDNGKGIPKSLLPHIFETNLLKTTEVSSDTNRNMGIGLSVCYSIISAHDGTMTANNDPITGGAVFTFTLPLKEVNNE